MSRLTEYVFNYSEGKGPAFWFRKKRSRIIKSIIVGLRKDAAAEITILDVGGTEEFWNTVELDFLRKYNVKITLLNLSAVDVGAKDIFTSVAGDGCALEFPDKSFDICFSNSVIEHVGDFTRMMAFARETRRVARHYYCQTPNFWFPIEPHFLCLGYQFLPEPLRVSLIRRFRLGHHKREKNVIDAVLSVQSARLLDRVYLCALFDDGTLIRERILFLTKSLIVTNVEGIRA